MSAHWGVLKLIHTDATLVCLSFFVTLYSPCSAHGTLQANIQHSFSNVLLRSPATIGSGLAVCGKVSLAQKIASSTLKTNSYNQRQDRYYCYAKKNRNARSVLSHSALSALY